MRAHILAVAVISGVIIVSLAAGHALTEHLLAITAEQGQAGEAAPVPHK